jgi:predicted N-acetyltransferase YhbS
MLIWAERALTREEDDGRSPLLSFAVSDDRRRIGLFRSRGYRREPWHDVQRWRELDEDLIVPAIAPGYRIRSLRPGDVEDASALAEVINAAFGHSFGPAELLNFERSPSFLADLQIVAVDEGDQIVAHAGVNLDRRNLLAIVEPVCTHPDHRRHGLARACMAEGLNRARAAGALSAVVSTGHDNASNIVYEQLGFTQVEIVEAWRKTFPAAEPAEETAR